MFNLDEAISKWRQQMLGSGIKSPVPMDELESHLREDIAQQMEAGANAEQAIEAAVRRIGEGKTLEAEFAKVVELKERRERKLKLFCIVFACVAYLTPLVLSAPVRWRRMNPAEQWFELAAVALTVISMFSGLIFRRFLPVIRDRRIRTKIQFLSILPVMAWICVFVFALLPCLELTVDQVTVAILWAISPLAAFGGLFYGLDEAAHRRISEV